MYIYIKKMVHLETLKVKMCSNVGKLKGELLVKRVVGIQKGPFSNEHGI